ncbi:MAG: 3-methyl-2-oxobutanoate hydroxymethyltransferase [Verrucomicrobiota bacterium]
MKSTARSVRALKGVRPVVCLTAYDAPTARMAAEGGADVILVGDSLGSVVLGLPDSVGVTLDMMVHHTAAVSRTTPDRLVVADLPFGVAHESFGRLLDACRRLLQEGGAQAVKIEGGASLAKSVAKLVDAGIPVMGHVGLLPQRSRSKGLRKQGLTPSERASILVDARAIEAAGAFAMVVECVDASFMPEITAAVGIPTIGIGSGRGCDGQILVIHDLLGLTPAPPPFARPEARLHRDAVATIRRWAAKVRRSSR